MIRSGELRYRINIYSITRTKNLTGEEERTLSLYRSVRAARKFIGGTTKEVDNQMAAQQTVDFKIRYDKNVEEEMVIIFDGKKYQTTYIYHTYEESTTIRTILIKDNNFGEPIT